MPGPLPLVPTALVNVLGNLGIQPSEGQHRHTAGGFLAIPHEVLALDPTRERAIDGDEPVGHRSCCNGLVLNYSGIRQQRHGRDRPDAEERQPELQVLAYHVDPQAKRADSGRRCSTGVMIPKGAAKARPHCSGYVAPAQHRPGSRWAVEAGSAQLRWGEGGSLSGSVTWWWRQSPANPSPPWGRFPGNGKFRRNRLFRAAT